MNESLENVEKRQRLVSQEDENAIHKELLYQRYNVKLINEIFKYFEAHGQTEDYIKLLIETEDRESGELAAYIDSESKSERNSGKIERISTGEDSRQSR